MKLNCTNCPWRTDRAACRACKQEQKAKERKTEQGAK